MLDLYIYKLHGRCLILIPDNHKSQTRPITLFALALCDKSMALGPAWQPTIGRWSVHGFRSRCIFAGLGGLMPWEKMLLLSTANPNLYPNIWESRNWNGSASEHTVAFLVLKICGAYLPNTKRFFGRKCLRMWRVILDLRCLQSNTNNVFVSNHS